MSSPKGETFREECEPTLPQGSPKGDMGGSEGGNARRHGGGGDGYQADSLLMAVRA